MYLKFASFFLSLTFFFTYCKTNADEVPAVLWNIKGDSLNIKPVSSLSRDDITFNENVENLVRHDASLLVFSMNQLSLEDFPSDKEPVASNSTLRNLQTFLDTRPYMFLSSVKEPLKHLHNVHCGVQEIVVDQNIDENVLQSISLAFGQSCVVILHITDAGIFRTNNPMPEDVKNIFLPSFVNSPKTIIGVFTADKSSWSGSSNEHHSLRNLLQAQEADPNFVNVTGCIYLYVEKVILQVGKEGNGTALPLPPDTTGSSCGGNETTTLKLKFKLTGDITSVAITFDFKTKAGAWVTDVSIALTGAKVPEGDLPAYGENIEAPMGFSFNCGNLKLKTRNETDVVVTMKGFQVQPFEVRDKFSPSFDCVPFFTIPIWMGVFVSLLFIIIINSGVYALFSVNTMDRFDDPKGKTISVAIGGD